LKETAASSDLGNCGFCGVAVRPNTFYCYNCGTKIERSSVAEELNPNGGGGPEMPGETLAASSSDKQEGSGIDPSKKRRRRTRTAASVKRYEAVWVPEAPRSNIFVIAVSLLVALLVSLIVYLVLYV
jgi:hypothetical protein